MEHAQQWKSTGHPVVTHIIHPHAQGQGSNLAFNVVVTAMLSAARHVRQLTAIMAGLTQLAAAAWYVFAAAALTEQMLQPYCRWQHLLPTNLKGIIVGLLHACRHVSSHECYEQRKHSLQHSKLATF